MTAYSIQSVFSNRENAERAAAFLKKRGQHPYVERRRHSAVSQKPHWAVLVPTKKKI